VTYGTRIPSEVRVSAVPKSSGKSKKRREHMKMETEIRVLQPQFKELSSCQLPPATRSWERGMEWILPQGLQRKPTLDSSLWDF
jgi:hypothetical protein